MMGPFDTEYLHRIYFDDGAKIGRREGYITFYDGFLIGIDKDETIPVARIVRTEAVR